MSTADTKECPICKGKGYTTFSSTRGPQNIPVASGRLKCECRKTPEEKAKDTAYDRAHERIC